MLDLNLTKTIDSLLELWPIKLATSVLATTVSFLFGNLTEAYLALAVLIFIDLATKWLEITKKHLLKHPEQGWWTSFEQCWKTEELSSYEMRTQFIPKMFSYFALIAATHQISMILPSRDIFGVQLGLALKDVAVSYLAITEFMSINENIMNMGGTFLAPFAFWVKDKRDKLLSVDDEKVKKFNSDFNNIDKSPHGIGAVIRKESEEK